MTASSAAQTGLLPSPLPAYQEREKNRSPLPNVRLLWFLAGAVLLTGLALAPVRRAQEARVLETAREMLAGGHGVRDWLVPHVNGHVRLEKPPLAYWLTAISFRLFGVNEFAGRLPNAIAGWLTLAVVYRLGRRAFSASVGFFAGASLLGSYLFFRHARLAETDVLATVFVTLAIHWLWRAADVEGANTPTLKLPLAFVRDSHLAAIATALAVLAKGPPAAFVAIFFVVLVAFTNRWHTIWRWLLTGAPLTLALIALPWFVYIRSLPEWPIIQRELRIALLGGEHQQPFYFYFPELLLAVAPWTGLVIVALIGAAMRGRRDPRLGVLLGWFAGIFLSLCLIRQRQMHYLIPTLPPLALLVGWWIDRAFADPTDAPLCRTILVVTLLVVAVGCLGTPIAARAIRGAIRADDLFFAAAGAVSALLVWLMLRARGLDRGVIGFAIVTPLMLVGFGIWATSLNAVSPRYVAALLKARYGADRPFFQYGDESLPLVWAMRNVMPPLRTPDELQLALLEHPNLVAIRQHRNSTAPPSPPPPGVDEDMVVKTSDETYHVYVASNH